jgi:hypothetical protein
MRPRALTTNRWQTTTTAPLFRVPQPRIGAAAAAAAELAAAAEKSTNTGRKLQLLNR